MNIEILCNKIDKLIAIIAIQDKPLEEQVRMLRLLEYSIPDISTFLGVSTRTIDNKIAELKKSGKLKK
ncbi:MAG: HTH domain-containing protein [Ignavibacteria bacterium]|nr:HTH domain-containing protein [Ignavibacteria bacterium]